MRISFTKHGILRVRERKVSLEKILNCISKPHKVVEEKEKTKYYKYYFIEKKLLEIVCVIAEDECKIITVIWTSQLNRYNK
ncbi:MAG: DUF4258 domain-containing protein [Patescibacteria group bacterium]